MSRIKYGIEAVEARGRGSGRETGSADIMLAPLRTVRKLHALAPPPQARGRVDELPLTSAQMRIWVFSQLNPELPLFNTFRAYRVSGPFRPDLLAKCLGEVAARHEVLRTTYPEIDGIPRPVIAEHADIPVEIGDALGMLTSGSEEEISDYCNQRISRPIDLVNGPIFRAELVEMTDSEHLLIMISHQMIFDGASWSILNRELTALYESGCSNSARMLNALPLQFLDFAIWQDALLQSEAFDRLLSYWRQQLGNTRPAIGLPSRGSAPTPTYHDAESLPFSVSAKLTAALKALAKEEGVTLFVVLLSAFHLLLRQFSNRGDPVIFTSVPCRTRPEFRNLIGLFSNFIPLRANLGGNPGFGEMLAEVQQLYSGALGHQDLPFEYITREFSGGQAGAEASLFQTLFVFENAARKSLSFTRCSLIPLNLKTGFTKFDITLFLEEKEGVLSGSLRYKPASYDAKMIELMVERLVTLLETVAAQPGRRIDDIRCLTPAEREVLQASNKSEGLAAGEDAARAAPVTPGQVSSAPVMPRTRMESRVAAVWQEVLGIDNIGIRDNFFDLGGNSLLLIKLAGRLQEALEHKVSIVEIFRDPTIQSFVARLDEPAGNGSAYDHVHERAAKRRAAMNRRKGRGRKG